MYACANIEFLVLSLSQVISNSLENLFQNLCAFGKEKLIDLYVIKNDNIPIKSTIKKFRLEILKKNDFEKRRNFPIRRTDVEDGEI